jgi:chemotaxis protein MotB
MRADEEGVDNLWLLTFSDLLLLLLAGFVMQLSMVSLDTDSVASGLGVALEQKVKMQQASIKLAKDVRRLLTAEIGSPEIVEGVEPTLLFPDEVQLKVLEKGVNLSLGGGRFLAGRRELSEETQALLVKLVPVLRTSNASIKVEGHSDSSPIATPEFPSNWELSAARAIEVAQHLIARGIPGSDISAVGYADTRPVATNSTEGGRTLNRRIELLLEPRLGH